MAEAARYAAIDFGTNSALLLVAERRGDALVPICELCEITRLGQGVDRSGELASSAILRTLETARRFATALAQTGVPAGRQARAAVGTAALRDAGNAAAFLEPAAAIIGCPVEIISGVREAELTRAGVGTTFAGLAADALICDVGGGSTEFVRALPQTAGVSLPLGSVRFFERYVVGDPPTDVSLGRLRAAIAETLSVLERVPPPSLVIGVAGTVTTLAAIELALDPYDGARVDGHRLSRSAVDAVADRLAALPLDARQRVVGLEPQRADVIVAGAEIVRGILKHFDAPELAVCDRGVRWGLVAERAAPR